MTNSSIVVHCDPEANAVLQTYVAAFSDSSSILAASTSRLASLRSAPWFADWCTTDCISTFDSGAGSTDELLIESSGTTAEPKLIRYSKQTLRDGATAIAKSLPLTVQREAYVSLVNPRLAYGLSITHSHVLAGVPVTVKPAPISLESWEMFRKELRADYSVYLLPHQSYMLAHNSFRLDEPIELVFPVAGSPGPSSTTSTHRSRMPRSSTCTVRPRWDRASRSERTRFQTSSKETWVRRCQV